MTIGDQVRRIEPSDQVVLDSDGNVVGLKSGKSSGLEGRMLLPTTADAVQALVSADGNLAYAAVATTTGTPGEVRKLSDGPDKGAALTWAIPEGRAVYAWCWQIYPLASYL